MTLNDISIQINETIPKVEKSLKHLQYSFKKILKIPADFDMEDLEILESFESFTSRFSKLTDIVCKKLLRSLIIKGDPSFKGSLSDFLNESEKFGYISDAKRWWAIRALRNKEAHDYTEEDLRKYFEIIKIESAFIIPEIESLLQKV